MLSCISRARRFCSWVTANCTACIAYSRNFRFASPNSFARRRTSFRVCSSLALIIVKMTTKMMAVRIETACENESTQFLFQVNGNISAVKTSVHTNNVPGKRIKTECETNGSSIRQVLPLPKKIIIPPIIFWTIK